MPKQKEKAIKFVRGYKVQNAEGNQYQVDQVVSLPEDSANHFINRDAAVEVEADQASKSTKKTASKKAASKKAD